MSKHVKIERVVDPGMDGNDIEIEKRGENTYRVRTGSDNEFDFRNRNKREAFREKFVDVYNSAVGDDNEDRFTLDPTEHKTRERFRKFERDLEEGRSSFDFRVRD
ncbi:MAG: hypothetical protein U9O20_00085 [Patescibacteria group bacterium]|nr:hypothetical protein [Patescibacteria group bacterium]